MRQLEFRAWDKENKRFVKGSDIDSDAIPTKNTKDGFSLKTSFILQQYVGLKDKNGKKVFEGDILGGTWEDGYIKYCDICKSFQYHANDFCFSCEGDVHWFELVEDDGKLEVKGNIFENPELLENL